MSEIRQPVADEVGVADSNGVRIGWRRYGDGPRSILFIPTWNFVDSRVLRHQVEGLRDHFRLLTCGTAGSPPKVTMSGRTGTLTSSQGAPSSAITVMSVLGKGSGSMPYRPAENRIVTPVPQEVAGSDWLGA